MSAWAGRGVIIMCTRLIASSIPPDKLDKGIQSMRLLAYRKNDKIALFSGPCTSPPEVNGYEVVEM